MAKLLIEQSLNLKGEIIISGAKNAALPIICAGLLSDSLILNNIPHLQDIETLSKLLSGMGAEINFKNSQMIIKADKIDKLIAPYELVKTMRASILVLGPLLARFGEAEVSLPGGCAIGARPVDQHIKGLIKMGAEIEIKNGYIQAKVPNKRLHGAKITMDVVTVTGTENLLMAATLATGTTVLENCALEPEVTDLANCLVKMGAHIEGIGTETMIIEGVEKLHEATHDVIADRIEAGTYLVAAAITKGHLLLKKVIPQHLGAIIDKLQHAGASIICGNDVIEINMNKRPHAFDIVTAPFPRFPTDMQAQFMALATISKGSSHLIETIFENRYMHVPELVRMGAKIKIEGNVAIVNGVENLTGANVMATDLRASASLVLAALVAENKTVIDRIYHLDRGYENLEQKLMHVGAKISRIN